MHMTGWREQGMAGVIYLRGRERLCRGGAIETGFYKTSMCPPGGQRGGLWAGKGQEGRSKDGGEGLREDLGRENKVLRKERADVG